MTASAQGSVARGGACSPPLPRGRLGHFCRGHRHRASALAAASGPSVATFTLRKETARIRRLSVSDLAATCSFLHFRNSPEACGVAIHPQRPGLRSHCRETVGGKVTTAEVLESQVRVPGPWGPSSEEDSACCVCPFRLVLCFRGRLCRPSPPPRTLAGG